MTKATSAASWKRLARRLLGDIGGAMAVEFAILVPTVIVITAHSSVESAVEAMKVGAYDYLTKDFSLDEIEVTVAKFFKYQELVKENKLLRYELGTRYGIRNIIGLSQPPRCLRL